MKQFYVLSAIALVAFCAFPSTQMAIDAAVPQRIRGSGRRSISPKDLSALIKELRARGATVKLSSDRISQTFFSARGRIIYVNGESVWIFSYPSTTTAEKDAKKISGDGMTIGNSKPSWLGTPHFFRQPRMIVLYLGDERRVLDVLERTLGGQFAGG